MELKQLKIDIYFNNTTTDINIVKRRYVEAAKVNIIKAFKRITKYKGVSNLKTCFSLSFSALI